MTSEERREARYQRRKAARDANKAKDKEMQDFKKIFTTDHLFKSYRKCIKGVKWKASTQKYIDNATLTLYRTKKSLLNGTFRSDGFYEFDLYERGKHRHISSVTIKERVVQRCLCDYSLVPLMSKTFIYDNGASLDKRGYHFAIRRLVRHLQYHYRKHGQEGYILLFDFTKFFDNVSHKVVEWLLRKQYQDKWTLGLILHFVRSFGNVGMGLGSQISQTLAVASANPLDHYVKEKQRIKGYARYMDDGYLIHHDKEYLQKCLDEIVKICQILDIKINMRKTQIVKLSHGFTWLKCRFYLLESGKVVRKIYKRSVTKMRQKLKAFKRLYDNKEMNFEQLRGSLQSWLSYALNFDACGTAKNTVLLIKDLFGVEETKKLLKVKKLRKNRIKPKMRYIQYLVRQMQYA
ncbi:MAG: Reverse transcriptase (RNA-dependent DNA polymerase) [Lachnospiraceae bacterium]|nr:Reverse transcriptase (RNA-dependent DNA polymerase) [Lachnospiraceae bacterium]